MIKRKTNSTNSYLQVQFVWCENPKLFLGCSTIYFNKFILIIIRFVPSTMYQFNYYNGKTFLLQRF